MIRSAFAAAALAVLSTGLAAQEDHGMPAPGAEHEKLHALAGEWTGEETYAPSEHKPEGGTGEAHTALTMVLGGFYLETAHESDMAGDGVYEGRGLTTWDAAEKAYVMYWFDNMGGMTESKGQWKDGALVLDGATEQGNFRYTWRPTSAEAMEFKIEFLDDSGTAHVWLSTKYTRSAGGDCCEKGAAAASEGELPDCCKEALRGTGKGKPVPACCEGNEGELGKNLSPCCRKALQAKSEADVPECCKEAAPCCKGEKHDHRGAPPEGTVEWFCPMHPDKVHAAEGACPACGMPLSKRVSSK